MTAKANRPPSGEPWIWHPLALRESDAWRSLGINARRFIDFLEREHMRHGGKQNGNLKAPFRQLEDFGIADRYVAATIREVEELGLVDCHRGGMRVATTYALTWLPTRDGEPPSNRWSAFRNPDLAPLSVPKTYKSALQREGSAALQREGRSGKSAPQREGRSAQNPALQREGALKRSSYQGGAARLGVEEEGSAGDTEGVAP